MGDFIEELLEALENKKVRKRIREIAGEEEKKGQTQGRTEISGSGNVVCFCFLLKHRDNITSSTVGLCN